MGPSDLGAEAGVPATTPGLRNWHLFLIVSLATLAVTIGTNRIVMTEEVYGRMIPAVDGSLAQVSQVLAEARRWERLAYVLTPVLLFARVGFSALLVQLALLVLGAPTPLASVFRGALWAQAASWLGSAAQLLWMSSLPASALTLATLEVPPGTVASFLPLPADGASPLGILLRQISLFDFAWITFFATAIEDGSAVRARTAFAAVGASWFAVTAVRWGALVYLTGFA